MVDKMVKASESLLMMFFDSNPDSVFPPKTPFHAHLCCVNTLWGYDMTGYDQEASKDGGNVKSSSVA
jgi:hypothetical protein